MAGRVEAVLENRETAPVHGQETWRERPLRFGLARLLVGLVLFGISFGYVEAAVVVYLRALYEPMRQQLHPERGAGDLFPLIRLDELQAAGDWHVHRLKTEIGREAATLGLLAAAGLLAGRNFSQWLAGVLIGFGVWDIFYYVFLKLLLDWPASLLTWDILFLLPVPWVGPVLAPVMVSASMILAGTTILWRESIGRPVRLRSGHWGVAVGSGVLIVAAFCWDFRNIAAGGYPNPFNWPLFVVGLLVGLAAFGHAFMRKTPLGPPWLRGEKQEAGGEEEQQGAQ